MGYVKLGQPSTTLSGGEAQRIKLAAELRKKSTGKTLYLLDEPTTGLHFHDIRLLLNCLNRLVEQGNTVLVIEHNLDVLKMADHILELGPGGGANGGELVCSGPPEKLAEEKTLTGKFLKKTLQGEPPVSYLTPTISDSDFVSEAPLKSKKRRKKISSKVQASKINGRDIQIRGASKNNLRHVDLNIPLNRMTVITGVSGSGKTSLAFDTLFAEGQSRYVESLSTYARRFLGRMDKAPVDSIDGLAPAIAINQKSTSRNPRSTVATTTEIYDYLRLLFARIGKAHCPTSGQPLIGYSPTRAAEYCLEKYKGERLELLAPLFIPGTKKTLLLDQPDHFPAVIETLIQEGFLRAYVKNKLVRLDEWEEQEPKLKKKTPIDLVIDRIEVSESEQKRFAEAIENAFQKGHGLLKLKRAGNDTDFEFLSETPACVETDFYQEEALTPRMFSFNSHVGACPACDGLGEHAYRISNPTCPECHGERLKPEYRAVTIQGRNISQFCNLNIREAQKELESWVLTPNQLTVAEQALREIQTRLDFLVNVGLDYLNLDQKASTLSGGEAQRIRLASQIGSGLVGVMYVLDEPTIGLHPRDTDRLIKTLKRLRDLGNTVILVEHDLETIRAADHIIDIGPGAGHYGGLVTASGSPAQISSRKNTLTGRYLKGEKRIPVPEQRRKALPGHELVVLGASANNLKEVDVRFPLGLMNVVTGVSGSGKSSLLVDVLQRALEKKMLDKRVEVGKHLEIKGYEKLEQLMVIDQEPIGRTPRSNPCHLYQGPGPDPRPFRQNERSPAQGFYQAEVFIQCP